MCTIFIAFMSVLIAARHIVGLLGVVEAGTKSLDGWINKEFRPEVHLVKHPVSCSGQSDSLVNPVVGSSQEDRMLCAIDVGCLCMVLGR